MGENSRNKQKRKAVEKQTLNSSFDGCLCQICRIPRIYGGFSQLPGKYIPET
jgi:hypothetical protein